MDIYQIFLTHNRPWSAGELVCFGIVAVIAATILGRCVRYKKIKKTQAVSIFGLLVFLGIVFGSTVFTREPTVRRYELVPFWSGREVIASHDWQLLQENLLNCILLFPMGMLLPLAFDRRVRVRNSFIAGFAVSAVIELCQLVFMRGLFEWDDMIHNGLGCMAGSLFMNKLIEKYDNPDKGDKEYPELHRNRKKDDMEEIPTDDV